MCSLKVAFSLDVVAILVVLFFLLYSANALMSTTLTKGFAASFLSVIVSGCIGNVLSIQLLRYFLLETFYILDDVGMGQKVLC